MKNRGLILVLSMAWYPIASAASLVQDSHPVPDRFTTVVSTETIAFTKSTDFLKTASAVLNIPFDQLKVLDAPRAPKTELLILALLYQKTHADLESLLTQRRQGKPLSRLVEEQGLDYQKIYLEAWQCKIKIEQKMRKTP